MANEVLGSLSDGSAEKIAYQLFLHIAEAEGIELSGQPASGGHRADRKWILSTYSECIWAVRTADYC